MNEDYDFFLFTDGSGHQDTYGGWASLVIGPRHNIVDARMAACKGTSVERAEFEALLMGLQAILDRTNSNGSGSLQRLERCPLKVFWVSDRESLVLSVTRTPEGTTVYRRKASPDLWARFEWYEKHFSITARHTKRETIPHHNIVDRLASDARVLVKDYMELPDNSEELIMAEVTRKMLATAQS